MRILTAPNEKSMGDAWGRRVARDWEKMPLVMRLGFKVSFFVDSTYIYISFLLMLVSLFMLAKIIDDSYLGFGNTLIGENVLFVPMYIVAGAAFLVRCILPVIVYLSIHGWYCSARKAFD